MTRALALLTLLVAALSLLAGKVWLSPHALWTDPQGALILTELRLPRVLLALLIGGALGLSGAVLQGYLRNPLADPSVVGIASTAALGAVAVLFVAPAAGPVAIFVAAMAGALLATLLLMSLSGSAASPAGFILAGVVLASLSGALTSFLVSIAPDPFAMGEIMGWLMGALTDRELADVARAAVPVIAGCALLLTTGRDLDALTLGDEAARSLGVDAAALRGRIVAGLCLTIGGAVAVTGVVGFVGLVVPHLVRRAGRQRPAALLLPSMVGGALLVVLADSAVRLTPGPGEVRLGVAMALLGAPFFLWMLRGEVRA